MAGSEGLNVLEQFPEAGETAGGDAFNVAIYAIVSMLVLVGIAYLGSRVMNNRRLEDWAKSEFVQVLISAALVGGLYFLMAPESGTIIVAFNSLVPSDSFFSSFSVGEFEMSSSGCSIAGIPGETVICHAYEYLGFLSAQILVLMMMIFSINAIIDVLARLAIDIVIVEVAPLAGLSSVVQVLNSIMQSLVLLDITVQVEMMLLVFINKTALAVFLPIGVVLRSFFATRRLGGTLIALSVGLYLVFPLTIALNALAVESVVEDSLENFQVVGNFYDITQDLNMISYFSGGQSLLSPESWNGYLENYVSTASALYDVLQKLPAALMNIVSLLVVQIVFLPLLSVVLTLIAIRELALLFGGEVNLSRFEV